MSEWQPVLQFFCDLAMMIVIVGSPFALIFAPYLALPPDEKNKPPTPETPPSESGE